MPGFLASNSSFMYFVHLWKHDSRQGGGHQFRMPNMSAVWKQKSMRGHGVLETRHAKHADCKRVALANEIWLLQEINPRQEGPKVRNNGMQSLPQRSVIVVYACKSLLLYREGVISCLDGVTVSAFAVPTLSLHSKHVFLAPMAGSFAPQPSGHRPAAARFCTLCGRADLCISQRLWRGAQIIL
ncbi:hypothetical protein EJ08DRAFT_161294 [Tothia fuscella]|uniref:Uncharacterized protein n=1 Tax=Tothia fuscella TaxID=1048955 RepID=A0A9P4U0M0_9PEZI|nr:hypothetical protein EJ08DRAFT_161294 [Tothia fuscella]